MEELKSQIGTEDLSPVEIIQNTPQFVQNPQPSDIVEVEPKPVYISYVRINIYSLILNWGFKCACYLLDDNKTVVSQQDLTIEGDEYNSWTDDAVMTDLILQKLGLSKKVLVL